jgi:hypothetical protein
MPPAGELARFGLQPAKLPSAIPGFFSPIPGKSGEKRGDGGDDDQDDDDGDGDDDDDGHDEVGALTLRNLISYRNPDDSRLGAAPSGTRSCLG